MPIFGHKDEHPDSATVEAVPAPAAPVDETELPLGSVEAIGALGRERMAEIKAKQFGSDMTTGELLWTHKAGFEPLGVVMGNSIYHVGLPVRGWKQNREVEVLTQAMYNARELAMTRMLVEAKLLEADGVLAVGYVLNRWNWATELLDVVVSGTAVRYTGETPLKRPATGEPFTTGHVGSSVWKLMRSGYQPMGLVFGNCVFHVAHQGVAGTLSRLGRNVEMTNYTQAVYDARELAMTRISHEATRLGADGLSNQVSSVHFHGWGDHVMEYYVWADAVAALDPKHDFPDPMGVKYPV